MTTPFPEPPRVEELDGLSAKLRQNLQRWMSDLKRWGNGAGGGTGTVTQIDVNLPLTAAPDPIVATGTLDIDTMTGDSGTGGLRGVVPAPAAGDTAAGKFLKASGAWAVPAAAAATITTKDEGVVLSATVTTIDFVGAGVTASGAGATTTVTIPGGTITVQDEGVTQSSSVTTLNFVGSAVVASGAGATETITINGAGSPGGQFNWGKYIAGQYGFRI